MSDEEARPSTTPDVDTEDDADVLTNDDVGASPFRPISDKKFERKDLQKVRAVKKHRPERDSLSLTEGQVLYIRSKDGMGWAEGETDDGEVGWFPMDKVEPIYDNPVGEVGKKDAEKTALDHFISEASKSKPSKSAAQRIRAMTADSHDRDKLRKRDSLRSFLETRPLREQLVDKNILASEETTQSVLAAQKRLEKSQKKKKKDAADTIVARMGGAINSNFKEVSESDFDQVVLSLCSLPLKKQKYKLTSYEDVVSGTTILQHLQQNDVCKRVFSISDSSKAKLAAQELVTRNAIMEASGVKPVFASKYLYHVRCLEAEYSILNIDKIWMGPARNVEEVAESLAREIIGIVSDSLPDLKVLQHSDRLRLFGLAMAELQRASFEGLSAMQQRVAWLNLFSVMVLYSHLKFTPPLSMVDRKYLTENCFLRIGNETLSLTDIERKALTKVSRDTWLVYCCLSECTITSPAMYVWTVDDYEQTQTHAARHFLNKHTVFDAGNYVMTLPKLCQHVWKDLKLVDKGDLVGLVTPLLAGDVREEVTKAQEIGKIDVKFAPASFDPSYTFEERTPFTPRDS